MTTLLARAAALLGLGGLMLSASAAEPVTLDIGDRAPSLAGSKWLKGQPVTQFKPGKVYLVEFWATWCTPCKQNIPHLTELAKKFAGKVDVVGVDVWESNDPKVETLPKVASFVKSMGDKMAYHVTADANTAPVANAWMRAAGEQALPTSFVVGKDGKIAWIGHPKDAEHVLEETLADRFDPAKAKAERIRAAGPAPAIRAAFDAKDYGMAAGLIDAAIAGDPASAPRFAYDRLVAAFHLDLEDGKRRAEPILGSGEIGAYQMIASIFASQKDLSPAAYAYGRTVVQQALAKHDREYLFFAMASEIDLSLGEHDAAVRDQTASVEAAEVDSHCPKEFLQMLKNKLAELQKTS